MGATSLDLGHAGAGEPTASMWIPYTVRTEIDSVEGQTSREGLRAKISDRMIPRCIERERNKQVHESGHRTYNVTRHGG